MLAHDIYKEFVEIQSAFTTGATTPVAEAAAARLRAAGFPSSDIFVGGASSKKANVVVRYHGTGALKLVPRKKTSPRQPRGPRKQCKDSQRRVQRGTRRSERLA